MKNETIVQLAGTSLSVYDERCSKGGPAVEWANGAEWFLNGKYLTKEEHTAIAKM